MTYDNDIVDTVKTALEHDSRIQNAAGVAVAERRGRVTLRGTVRSIRQRRTVVEIARGVRGVRAVDDGLRIDPRDHWQDDRIRGAALQALMSDDRVPERVDVAVASGWLTLTGEVKRQAESDAAYAAVAGLPGVGGITNKIIVVSAGA